MTMMVSRERPVSFPGSRAVPGTVFGADSSLLLSSYVFLIFLYSLPISHRFYSMCDSFCNILASFESPLMHCEWVPESLYS